jgi:hypothetical protein
MKIHFFIAFLIIFFGSNAAFSQVQPLPSGFQSWNERQLILPIVQTKDYKGKNIDKVTATFNGILRIGRKNFDFLDNRAGVTLDFRVNKYLSLLTGTLHRKDELVENVRRYETRLDFGATLSKNWGKFSFRDRNMFERRFRNGRADINLYRQRIQANYLIKHKNKLIFSPFVSEEGYFDLGSKIWLQNEFFAGITRVLNRKTSIDIAYVRNDSRPVNVNGLSLNLKIRLK